MSHLITPFSAIQAEGTDVHINLQRS